MKKNSLTIFLMSLSLAVSLVTVRPVVSGAYEYDAKGKRDPFVPLVGVSVQSPVLGGVEGIQTIADASLQGIVVGTGGEWNIILNGEIMKKGDTKGKVTIVSVEPGEVQLTIDGVEHTIKLYE